MNTRNTKRLLAFLLTVAMLLPMIAVPSFGAEAETAAEDEYLYENTFESYTEGHVWSSTDSYFEINPNNKLSSSTSKHMVIKNPEDSADLVWKFPMESANNRNHLYLATDGFSYATTPKIIFSFDFYVPDDAYGSFFFELRTAKYTSGSGNPSIFCIKMGTSSSTTETVVLEDRQDSGNYKQHPINRGQWYRISYAWDMINGTYRTCLDEELIFSGKRYTSSSIQFTNTTFADINLYSYDTYCGQWGGNLLLDDIRISDNSAEYFPAYENTFESYTVGNTMTDTSAGRGFMASLEGYGYTLAADPIDEANGNQTMQIPLANSGNTDSGTATLHSHSNTYYKSVPVLTMEHELYIPSESTGIIKIQTWQYSAPDSGTATAGFRDWIYIDFSTADQAANFYINTYKASAVKTGNLTLNRDTWYTLTFSLNQVTGEFYFLINGEVAIIGACTLTNFCVESYFYAKKHSADASGNVYVDDIRVYENFFDKGVEAKYRTFNNAYENSFESYTAGSAMTDTTSGKGFSGDLSGLGYTVETDPNSADNKVLQVPVTDAAADNYKAATAEISTPSDYTQAPQITFDEDIYIPSGAVGYAKIQGWERYSADSNVWQDFFYINFTAASSAATIEFPSSFDYSVKGANLKLNRDTWYTLTVSLKQNTGEMTVLVDGEIVFAGNLGAATNIAQIFVGRMKTASACGVTLSGSVYIDNVRIYKNCYDAGKTSANRAYKWSNDFESYTVDSLVTDTSSASGFSASLSATYGCTTVCDPLSPYNKVMRVPTENGNNYIGQTYDWRSQGDAYQAMTKLVFEQDIYLPAATTGKTRVQGWQKVPTEGFLTYYELDFSTANADVTVKPAGVTSYTGALTLKRDTWHTVTFSIEQSTGAYCLLIDGVVAAVGALSSTGMMACTWFFFRSYAGASGAVYLDNMKIYEGYDKGLSYDSALYRSDFQNYTAGHVWTEADEYFNTNPNTPAGFADDGVLNHTVVTDPTHTANLVWQIPLNEANLNNNQVQTATSSAVRYEETPEITLSMDVYIPSGSKGDVKMQGYSDAGGFNDLYHILMQGSSATVWVDDTVAYTGDRTLTLDAWHTVEYSVRLATGEFKLIVDGNLVYSGNNGYTNVSWNFFILAKLQSTANVAAYTGTLLLDNIVLLPELANGTAASTSNLYENTMEQYWSDYVIEGDSYFNGSINASNQGHTIVTDPASNANKVWQIPMGGANTNNNSSALKIGDNVLHYESTPHVVFETDLYIPTGTTGTFLMEGWGRNRKNDGIDTTDFIYFYTVDVTSVKAEITPYGQYSYAGENLELQRDTWYTVAYAIEMLTGEYTVYINGEVAATGVTGQVELFVSGDSFIVGKVETTRAGTGFVCLDDLKIYQGEEPDNTVIGESSTEDFAEETNGNYIPAVGANDTMTHSVYSYAVHDHLVLSAEYTVASGASGVIESKFEEYRYLVANVWGIGGELSLYTVDFDAGKLYQKNTPSIYASIEAGKTYTVTTVIDLVTGNYTVYVNGIGAFNASVGNTNLTLGATADHLWQYASVTSDTVAGVTVDNLTARLLASSDLITIATDSSKTLQYIDLTIGSTTARTGVDTLFLPADTVYTATTVYFDAAMYENIITTEKKASVRLKELSGLRFATLINDIDAWNALFDSVGSEVAEVYFSTLITPADYLTMANDVFTKEALDALLGVNSGAAAYLDLRGERGQYFDVDENAETIHFVGSIVNLKQGNYGRDFAGIGYLSITLYTGEVIAVYSAQSHQANVNETAISVKNEYPDYVAGLSASMKAIFDAFVDYTAPTVTVTEDTVPTLSTFGTLSNTYTTKEEGIYYLYKSVTEAEITAYKSALVAAGFTLYASNTLDSCEFATYTGNTKSVRLFCYPTDGEFRILVTDLAYLPKTSAPEYEAIEGLAPTVTQIERNGVKQGSTGQSFIVQLVDGSFAIVDGGPQDAEDAYNLLQYLYEHKPESHAKPRITWFFTHSHSDHMDLALNFMEAYSNLIDLETVAYNFPDYNGDFSATNESNTEGLRRQQRLESLLASYYPTTTAYVFHTGDKLYLPGCTVEILMTYLDFHPDTFAGINEASSVFKFTFDSGYDFLVTGDMYPGNCSFLIANYPTALKCDIVQTPHHGRDGANADFYNAILDEMKILMWTNSVAFLEVRAGSANDASDWSHNDAVLASETIKHYTASQTVTVNMNDLGVTVEE